MKAVKRSDFIKYGCVNCGCEYCYSDGFSGPSMIVICAECKEKFFIMNDSLKISNIGISKKSYDGFIISEEIGKKETTLIDFLSMLDLTNEEKIERMKNGFALEKNGYVYPIALGHHPREGIEKHPLILPDIRPEGNHGDYCYPRGVGYDLACFVKSKEAGERITNMINQTVKDYPEKKTYHCRLDYRISEPLWIQIKIEYQNRLRALYLAKLIEDNDFIISESIVRTSLNKEIEEIQLILEKKEKVFQKALK